MKSSIFILPLILLLSACGSGSEGAAKTQVIPEVKKPEPVGEAENLAIPDNRALDAYQVLVIGNSHVQSIQKLLTIIFQHGFEEKEINIDTRVGAFLDVIVDKESLIELIETRPWTHIILQGQKYSQSQSVLYSTEAAKTWIQRTKKKGATPILFPEHPQKGSVTEAGYVHSIHVDIADEESSCIAPVGLSWNKVLAIEPELNLYQADGNHATELGALLSALVLYQVVSGQIADTLPYVADLPGTATEQALLGQIASQTVAEQVPCAF
ncbi:hypothetical protein [Colwellia psychrerythraea]|uniref:Lipoprotein n=1 Tax=Colwellia psychrerythraea TaxID=28229 RepID=A0A099KBG8_COLPS|nr:hypothetical protein [Colwellia psychrerythraea]KGJ87620.1 hypothetical protein ND2E_4358 [Colwellia psychrerythraea]